MRLRRLFGAVLFQVATVVALSAHAAGCDTSHRVALVIGDGAYPDVDSPLALPGDNARRVAETVRRDGFDTMVETDLTKTKMTAALQEWRDKLGPKSVGLFFFSGFGVQTNGHSYLLPVDAKVWAEQDVRRDGFNLDTVISDASARGAKALLVVIDAARRNPFERRFREISRGLAPVAGADNVLVLYSNVPDDSFNDPHGSSSPFVDALVQQLSSPHSKAEEAFRKTRVDVSRLSGNVPRPWMSSTLSEEVSLDPTSCNSPTVANTDSGTQRSIAEPNAANAPVRDAQPTPPSAPNPPQQTASAAINDPPPNTASQPPAPPQTPVAAPPSRQAKLETPPAPNPVPQTAPQDNSDAAITDPKMLEEIRDRLFEMNLDPGSVGSTEMRGAILAYETTTGLPSNPTPTMGLLQNLRGAKALGPWGVIAFSPNAKTWGMSWGSTTRRQAIAEAQARCGKHPCTSQMAFYGQRCAAFALSSASWSISARDNGSVARTAAIEDCARRGGACRLIGSVCADGSERSN